MDRTEQLILCRQKAIYLVRKLRLIHEDPQYRGIWELARVHGVDYKGPQYDQELRDLEDAIQAANPPSSS